MTYVRTLIHKGGVVAGDDELLDVEVIRSEWIVWMTENKRSMPFEAWALAQGYEFVEQAAPVVRPTGRNRSEIDRAPRAGNKYPWAEWTDGEEWEVEQGVHFTCSVQSFRSYLYAYAVEHGLEVETKRLSRREPLVWFRFYKPQYE